MAGSGLPSPITPVQRNPTQSQLSQVEEQWKVQYARFIVYSTGTEHPSLVHIPEFRIRARGGGTWISSNASASLKIVYTVSSAQSSDALLVVCVKGHVLEEHYITSMHFSWPHVSCLVGFPPRGTKTIFVSYKDGKRQIQKFALRFSSVEETEKFVNLLKELVANASPQKMIRVHKPSSESSSQVELIPSDEPVYRPMKDWCSTARVDDGTKKTLPSSEPVVAQGLAPKNMETDKCPTTFPLNFTQLVNNCDAQIAAKPKDSVGHMQTEFVKYLGETSFQELLNSVENVINDFGDEFLA